MAAMGRKAPRRRDDGQSRENQTHVPTGGTLPITRGISDEEYRAQWASLTEAARPGMDWSHHLRYLPELEAEIFWLLHDRKKNQKDVATVLGLSQSTISYRFKRAVDKLAYIVLISAVDLKSILAEIPGLKERETKILIDLFHYTNQDRVGRLHGTRQSTVKWCFLKTKRNIEKLETSSPERWQVHLGLFYLLERYLKTRVWASDDPLPPPATRRVT